MYSCKMQAECPMANKEELNEMRLNKLAKKRF
jgi:hypothetical protein